MKNFDLIRNWIVAGKPLIPVSHQNKRPLVKWEWCQKQAADSEQWNKWAKRYSDCNFGLVCGELAGIMAIDCDSPEARDTVQGFLPEGMGPAVQTPRPGWHYYFLYRPGLSGRADTKNKVDIRTEGNFIIIPPSEYEEKYINDPGTHAGKYEWLAELKLYDLPEMPDELFDFLKNGAGPSKAERASKRSRSAPNIKNKRFIYRGNNSLINNTWRQVATDGDKWRQNFKNKIPEGSRDKTLYHIAHHLFHGNMPEQEIQQFLLLINEFCCDPPDKKRKAKEKIGSVVQRAERLNRNISKLVEDFVLATDGDFLATNAHKWLHLATRNYRQAANTKLRRLLDQGIIEKASNRDGHYRKVDTDFEPIDIDKVEKKILPLKFPLDLHEHFNPKPKNIAVFSGTQDVGKSALCLQFAALNAGCGLPVRYLTSEMGCDELVTRLDLFKYTKRDTWRQIEFIERSSNFQDLILPDGVTVIDYFEVTQDFFKVGGYFKKIHDKLASGFCLIAIQMDPKKELGRGDTFSLEKPRLYVTLKANPPEGNIAKIVKCKNWANIAMNPNRLECYFKVVQGWDIRQLTSWQRYDPVKAK